MSRKDKLKTRTRVMEEFSAKSFNFRILEKTSDYGYGPNVDWRFEITHSSPNGYSTASFPLANYAVIDAMVGALARTRDAMLTGPITEAASPRRVYRGVEGGAKLEEVWSEEMVVSRYSTETTLLGWRKKSDDGETFIPWDPLDGPAPTSGSSGSSPSYSVEDIGKPRRAVGETCAFDPADQII